MHLATRVQRRRNGDARDRRAQAPPSTDRVDRRRPTPPGSRRAWRRLRDSLQQLLAFASLIAIVVFFSFASPNFFTPSNIIGILMRPPSSSGSWPWARRS